MQYLNVCSCTFVQYFFYLELPIQILMFRENYFQVLRQGYYVVKKLITIGLNVDYNIELNTATSHLQLVGSSRIISISAVLQISNSTQLITI